MKPRNKFEKEILKASESLRPISEKQIKWGYRHAVSHFGRRNSDGTILCAECGHRYHTSGKGEHSICPKCHTRLNIVNNPRQRKFKEQDYFAVVDTCEGYQVVRYIMVYHTAIIGKEPLMFRKPPYSAGWGKKKNAGNQVIFSVLRWKFGLPCDPRGSSDLKCGEISMKCLSKRNLLI